MFGLPDDVPCLTGRENFVLPHDGFVNFVPVDKAIAFTVLFNGTAVVTNSDCRLVTSVPPVRLAACPASIW